MNLADRGCWRETPRLSKMLPSVLLRRSQIPWNRVDHQTPRALKLKTSLWGESVMRSQSIDLAWETLMQSWHQTRNKKLGIPTVCFQRILQLARSPMINMDKLLKVLKKIRHHPLLLSPPFIRLIPNQIWRLSSFSKLKKQGFRIRLQLKRILWQAETTSSNKKVIFKRANMALLASQVTAQNGLINA